MVHGLTDAAGFISADERKLSRDLPVHHDIGSSDFLPAACRYSRFCLVPEIPMTPEIRSLEHPGHSPRSVIVPRA